MNGRMAEVSDKMDHTDDRNPLSVKQITPNSRLKRLSDPTPQYSGKSLNDLKLHPSHLQG